MDGPDQSLDFEKAHQVFSLWSVVNLRDYLSKRGWSTKGTKEILIGKAVCAWKREDPVLSSALDEQNRNKRDFEALLVTPTASLPNPSTLTQGWQNEAEGMKNWSPVFITDMSSFLMASYPDGKDYNHRLLNEYKEGKAYR